MNKDSISITLLPGTETLVIKKAIDSRVFILTTDSIIMSRNTLIVILKYMMEHDMINHKTIEGLIEEFHTE